MVIEGPPVPFEPRTRRFFPAVDSLSFTDSKPDANLPYFELASNSKRLSLGKVMSTPLYSASMTIGLTCGWEFLMAISPCYPFTLILPSTFSSSMRW